MSFELDHTPVRILGIGGDMSERSLSRSALQNALRIAEQAGATSVLADIRDLNLPLYNSDWPLAQYPESLGWLLAQARFADAFIICSPDYHFTVSGAVKNVLDTFNFLEDQGYLGGKPVGLMATGVAVGNVVTALDHAVHDLNGLVVPTFAGIPSAAIDPATGSIPAPAQERLATMVGEVIDLARRLRPVDSPVHVST